MNRHASLTIPLVLAFLLSGCGTNSPLSSIGDGAAEMAGKVLLGLPSDGEASGQRSTSTSARTNTRSADRPMVRTRRVSPGNPGDLYTGQVRTANGGYTVMLTLLDGRFSHASYPDVACASNLKAVRSYYGDSMTFVEHVYEDAEGQCVPSEQLAVKPQRDGSVLLRTISDGQVTGEGSLRPSVVPVPDNLVGDWEAELGGKYGGPRSTIYVRLAQDGESFTEFEDNYCSGRSRFAFMTSGSMSLAGFQEPTECDDGGMVSYQQINRNMLERRTYTPDGRVASSVRMARR